MVDRPPEAPTEGMPQGLLAAGQVLGGRYQVQSQLGSGGMGEVWQAFDLKLRVEVALKALREDLFQDEQRRELLRREVRAAREVVSPNVCRIFDLIEADGRELVSMEYVDGQTLLQVLQERGPLELKEAQDIASQFLAGLEAIHSSGLVHRDVKPENIMLTRAGRVVVMDFGLARQGDSGAASVSGTPAYMAPEQAAGLRVDARADVYSAGVVLAEMVSPEGIRSFESRQSVWEGVRSEPAKVPDSPWAPVLRKAVAKEREARYGSAHTLTRALEDVTLRVEGAEDLHPYPGLESFTEEDAEYFFGREAEVEQMWRKLGDAHLLAIVGPSGAGKTSFIAAGLAPSAPSGWAIVRCTPGNTAMASLATVVAREMAGDADAVSLLPRFDDADVAVEVFSRWRHAHGEALLVVDQFEELFTQNSTEVRSRVARLLGRLVLEAGVRVLLAMRDDFLMECKLYEPLLPLFESLVPLMPPSGGALRRALVQPATKCGYRFEDDALVEEMLTEVEGERGALPLLAFATARVWEKRDRDSGLLTREAYHDIGGVGGALARHAEATMDRIGAERVPMVRELFRNLVTSEGTRAVREWDELLSVFGAPQRDVAEKVLRELIDARLLTSYEVQEEEEEGEPARRVEIVHESLLANWPRLVRWQTQDADAAQLRDQLRQAARTWDEHGRPDDLLWSGSAFREYQVWRERYPGGLTELEEAFARAMTSLASRRRRRRRLVLAAAFVALLAVLGIVGVSRQQAIAEANRAEASKLVALGRLALEANRTETLAYAIASLERADTPEARRLALRALWAGPPATVLPLAELPMTLAFSPDGRTLAAGCSDGRVRVFPRAGGAPLTLGAFGEDQGAVGWLSFSPDGRLLVGSRLEADGEVRVWETEGWELVEVLRAPEPPEMLRDNAGWSYGFGLVEPDLPTVVTMTFVYPDEAWQSRSQDVGRWVVRRWPLDGGPPELVGQVAGVMTPFPSLNLSSGLLAVATTSELRVYRLDTLGSGPLRVVGPHSGGVVWGWNLALDPTGERLAACDVDGTVRVWNLNGDGTSYERAFETPGASRQTIFSPDGSSLAHCSGTSGGRLWDLRGPAFAEPVRLGLKAPEIMRVAFTPDGWWLASASPDQEHDKLALWPLTGRSSWVLRVDEGTLRPLMRFHPDGSRLYTVVAEKDGREALLSWPLSGGAGVQPTVLLRGTELSSSQIAMDPRGRFLVIGTYQGVQKVPLDGGAPTVLDGVPRLGSLSLDPTGRYLAASEGTIVVLDLETGERLEPVVPGEGPVARVIFDAGGRLLVVRGDVLSRWDPRTGTTEPVVEEGLYWASPAGDSGRLYVRSGSTGSIVGSTRCILDPEGGSLTELPQVHQSPGTISFDATGSIVTSAHPDGEVRVGRLFDEEPHLLLGHEMGDTAAQVSPDGTLVASLGFDGTIRLWRMPDLDKPPFHVLPHDDLMARLKALTNLRAVTDEESHTGYRIEPDFTAYHGWQTMLTW